MNPFILKTESTSSKIWSKSETERKGAYNARESKKNNTEYNDRSFFIKPNGFCSY